MRDDETRILFRHYFDSSSGALRVLNQEAIPCCLQPRTYPKVDILCRFDGGLSIDSEVQSLHQRTGEVLLLSTQPVPANTILPADVRNASQLGWMPARSERPIQKLAPLQRQGT